MTGCSPTDRRSPALVAVETAARQLRAAVVAQRSATADHDDFYALSGVVVDILRALSSLAAVLDAQVAGYGGGRALRDDAGHDPAIRLGDGAELMALVRQDVDRTERAANRFWSEISHIEAEGPR